MVPSPLQGLYEARGSEAFIPDGIAQRFITKYWISLALNRVTQIRR